MPSTAKLSLAFVLVVIVGVVDATYRGHWTRVYHGVKNRTVSCAAYDVDKDHLYGWEWDDSWASIIRLTAIDYDFRFSFVVRQNDRDACEYEGGAMQDMNDYGGTYGARNATNAGLSIDVDEHFRAWCSPRTDNMIVVNVEYARHTIFDAARWTCEAWKSGDRDRPPPMHMRMVSEEETGHRLPTLRPTATGMSIERDGDDHYALVCSNPDYDMYENDVASRVATSKRMAPVPVEMLLESSSTRYMYVFGELFGRNRLRPSENGDASDDYDIAAWPETMRATCAGRTTYAQRMCVVATWDGRASDDYGWPPSKRNASLNGFVAGVDTALSVGTARVLNTCPHGERPNEMIASASLSAAGLRSLIDGDVADIDGRGSIRARCSTMGVRSKAEPFVGIVTDMLCRHLDRIRDFERAALPTPRISSYTSTDDSEYIVSCDVPPACRTTVTVEMTDFNRSLTTTTNNNETLVVAASMPTAVGYRPDFLMAHVSTSDARARFAEPVVRCVYLDVASTWVDAASSTMKGECNTCVSITSVVETTMTTVVRTIVYTNGTETNTTTTTFE